MLATIVDTGALLKSIAGGLAAALVVTAAFSVALFGAVRFAELRRDGRALMAAASGIVVALALIAWAGAIVLGIVVMTQK